MKILDCTLRDGGYYTNWDFDFDLVKNYFESTNHLPIEFLEVGYRSPQLKGYFGKYYYCPDFVLKQMRELSNKELVIILNEKDIELSTVNELLKPCIGIISMVRIAIDPKRLIQGIQLAEKVKAMGFLTGFNVMYMSKWKTLDGFTDDLKKVQNVADYFYMVDSYGGVFPNDVKETFELVKNYTTAKIGFHGHNNLEMALANTIAAIDAGVEIVDATITGMGRGAGNLKTELLLTTLNSKTNLEVSFNHLSKVVDGFSKLQKEYEWGTNLPYMVSGANSLPQKEVMDWVGKRYYSFNSIIRALNNQSKGQKDNTKLPELIFDNEKKYASALLVGGGESVKQHSKAIELFLEENPSTLVIHASSKNAMNFSTIQNDQFFCLVGNEGHRLEEVFNNSKISGKCILPPYPRTMGTYIPTAMRDLSYELSNINFTDLYKDSHTALALQSILEFGISTVFVVGYDGYFGEIGEKEQELFFENQYLFKQSKIKEVELISLTPSKYSELQEESIYSKI